MGPGEQRVVGERRGDLRGVVVSPAPDGIAKDAFHSTQEAFGRCAQRGHDITPSAGVLLQSLPEQASPDVRGVLYIEHMFDILSMPGVDP